MVNRVLVIALVVSLLLLGCYRTSPKDAERLAEARLQEYAAKASVDRSVFGKATKSIEADGRQVFDYTSEARLAHLVRIYVHRDGRVEMHSMVDSPTIPEEPASIRGQTKETTLNDEHSENHHGS